MLVGKEDYKKIYEYIEKQQFKNETFETEKPGCCKAFLNKVSFCIGCIYTTPFQVIRYITIGCCVIVPFVVAYCY